MERSYQSEQDTMEDLLRSFPMVSVTHLMQGHHQELMQSMRSGERSAEGDGYLSRLPAYATSNHTLYQDQHSPIEPTSDMFIEEEQENITTQEKKRRSSWWGESKPKNKDNSSS